MGEDVHAPRLDDGVEAPVPPLVGVTPAVSRAPVSVIVLTYNEEANIAQALRSVTGWARQVLVLDSFSTDRTVEIAGELGATVVQNRFVNFAAQRNFALASLPITEEWILFLDADEWLPDALKDEIDRVLQRDPAESAFYMKRRMMWEGTWIRRGYYPAWILRLARHKAVSCEAREVNEHLIVTGTTGRLTEDFIHDDHKGVDEWVRKHNGYATREARELLVADAQQAQYLAPRLFGGQAERKRWLRQRIWNRMPPLVRPLCYFFYRFVLTGGFLDGRTAFGYHVMQALWYPLLIDIKYLELRRAAGRDTAD